MKAKLYSCIWSSVILFTSLTLQAADGAGLETCQTKVETKLEKKNLLNKLSLYTAEEVTSGTNNDSITGYRFWYTVNGCSKGHLVVDSNEFCSVQQIYTRGACRIPGVRHSRW